MPHTDYTKTPETFLGLLPSANANDIADLFAEGQSVTSVLGSYRIKGQKLSDTLVKTVYNHIKEIEKTVVNILNGSSMVYSPPEIIDEEGEVIGYAWKAPTIPTTRKELLTTLMEVVTLDSERLPNVYDADFTELVGQITHVVDNIISAQISNGTGTFEDLKNALSNE